MVFRDEVIRFRWDHVDGAPILWEETPEFAVSLTALWGHRETLAVFKVRIEPSLGNWIGQHSCVRLPRLQNWEIIFCCFSYDIYGHLLWQPTYIWFIASKKWDLSFSKNLAGRSTFPIASNRQQLEGNRKGLISMMSELLCVKEFVLLLDQLKMPWPPWGWPSTTCSCLVP